MAARDPYEFPSRFLKDRQLRLLLVKVRDYLILLLDAEGRIRGWNEGARRITGYRREEMLGRPFALCFREEDRLRGEPERLLKAAARRGSVRERGWRLRKDGSLYLQEGAITALRERRKLVAFLKITQDVTQRDVARRSLSQSRALIQAADAERGRMARDLHDSLNQQLAAALLVLRGAEDARVDGRKARARAARILASAIADVRRIAHNVQPVVLEELGLAAAVRALARQVTASGRLRVRVSGGSSLPALDARVALAAYRIVQEAVQNVVRHAGPSTPG